MLCVCDKTLFSYKIENGSEQHSLCLVELPTWYSQSEKTSILRSWIARNL